MRVALVMLGLSMIALVSDGVAQTRIDLYDKYSNRTGYAVIDQRTGRVDLFDKYHNRTGSATITAPPMRPPTDPPRPLDLQPIPPEKGGSRGR